MLYFNMRIINHHMNYNYISNQRKEMVEKYRIDGIDELIANLHGDKRETRQYYAFGIKQMLSFNGEASTLNDII